MIGVRFDRKDIVRIDKSSALPQLAQSLLTQFQKVLWAWDGGDVDKDTTGIIRRAWNLLDVICRIIEPARRHYNPSPHTMRNLDMCRKIYERARSSEHPSQGNLSRDPIQVWNTPPWWIGLVHSPEDFDWLVDYLDYIHSDDHETAYDILLLLSGLGARCSPAKQHMFIKSLIACMDSDMPYNLRHAALRAVHIVRQEITSIDGIDDVSLRDMVLTELSPAILTVVCPRPGTTPADDGPDRFLDSSRGSCYLELVFSLASNSDWYSHLSGDHHIDWCISMVAKYHQILPHAFYLAGILLRIAPEQLSATSLDSITEQQWWDMMKSAWAGVPYEIDLHCFEFLPVLVEATKKYMQIASKFDLELLIRHVGSVLERLERQYSEQGEHGEHGEGAAVAMKELKTVASDMLERMVKSDEAVSP
ncbi:hypothetical protein DEU56DRAFT_800536 [Suillus clintonianus]|uniref:uncharacterized protein n=1 Tax=Suillus clintonianus TaxID=1904413 RepID=UPI001B876F0A|nr:uncharacterized protein DEU56DRAFT_800536 [Suillus clintonianus]KAG2139285.1 hypothetical protein DEU56DRAFT_800536 [Suillus clintonianus]